jgi:3-deoxy-manno-octulosonate cytidylyltransferase (CMP-KDO synthetase)
VVTDRNDYALYFSRAPIPLGRDVIEQLETRFAEIEAYKHIGLYVYRRDFLLTYHKLAPTPLEQLEKLEQLRALENGFRMKVAETKLSSFGVDTPEDLERVRQLLMITSDRHF